MPCAIQLKKKLMTYRSKGSTFAFFGQDIKKLFKTFTVGAYMYIKIYTEDFVCQIVTVIQNMGSSLLVHLQVIKGLYIVYRDHSTSAHKYSVDI